MIIRSAILQVVAAIAVAACGGSHGVAPPVVTGPQFPVVASTVLGGDSDALAAELMLAGARRDRAVWHRSQSSVATPAIAEALDAMALDHAESSVFGAGAGPTLLGSAHVRRLAAAPNAPIDLNAQNGNLDESLLAEAIRIAAFAAATPPAMDAVPLLPWRSRSAELAGALGPADNATWATRDLGDLTIDVARLAGFLEVRITAARRLLYDRSPGRFGADPDSGRLGLLALQQVLAAEESLFLAAFTAGDALGPLENPRAYDPTAAPRWLPRSMRADLDPAVAGAAAGFRTVDNASDLAALGKILRVAVDLSTIGKPEAVLPVPELFRNTPFLPPPRIPPPPSITWSVNIRPLLTHRCGICHLQQTFGGFSITSYETMLLGGNKTRLFNLQFIIPGNSEESLLHQILTGPPPPFVQMPFVGEILPSEVALIDAWIDAGALKNPPTPAPPPQAGDDLALVSFRNLAALHLDTTRGALHHRYESDGPSGIATAYATGVGLRGLAEFAREHPAEPFEGRAAIELLRLATEFATAFLVDSQGRVHDRVDLRTGLATGVADLEAHAALTGGLLAAAEALQPGHPVPAAAARAAEFLLSGFGNGEGDFGLAAGSPPSHYRAATLAELLTALRYAIRARIAGAHDQRERLLQRLRPVLAFAEWDRDGEVLGDGIADTDGDGVPEPAAAGSGFGRLPLVADHWVIDPAIAPAPRTPTWSEHIRPMLEQKCGECHMNGAANGDYRLDTLRALLTPGESQGRFAMLVPGDPDASFFFRKIASRQPGLGSQMPRQRTPLDQAAVGLIRAWIEHGASAR